LEPKPKKVAPPVSLPSTPVKAEKLPKPKFRANSSDIGRKYTRASTVSKTVETVKRQKERALKAKKMLKKKMMMKKTTNNRELTQEELLEEAKETELLNIESLKKFQQVMFNFDLKS
jgi:vacuolar protein sorting-associated protein 72